MEGVGYVIDGKVGNGEGCKKILRVVGRARKELAGAVRQYAPLKQDYSTFYARRLSSSKVNLPSVILWFCRDYITCQDSSLYFTDS
jgi:hypothetical protein